MKYVIGIDVGKGDKSSLAIINEKCEVVSLTEWGGSDYPTIMAKMLIKINEYKCEKGYIETNGVGSPLFDFMVKELGKSKLLAWVSTNTSKNNMIENFMNGFDKNNIKILDTYYDLLTSQLDNVTVEYNPTTRTIKYLFARDEDGHSDSVISTGLAYKAWCDFFIKGTAKIQLC